MVQVDITVALIAAAGSAVGTFGGIVTNPKLTTFKIQKLEDEVRKHNSLIDRTYKLEAAKEVVEEQMKVVNHRISDLEKKEETK